MGRAREKEDRAGRVGSGQEASTDPEKQFQEAARVGPTGRDANARISAALRHRRVWKDEREVCKINRVVQQTLSAKDDPILAHQRLHSEAAAIIPQKPQRAWQLLGPRC